MCLTFRNQDPQYDAWRHANPGGFVFNRYGGRNDTMNVMHRRADCDHLNRLADAGHRTDSYGKSCCLIQTCIENEANGFRAGRGWVWCSDC